MFKSARDLHKSTETPVNITVYGGLFLKGDGIGDGKMSLNPFPTSTCQTEI